MTQLVTRGPLGFPEKQVGKEVEGPLQRVVVLGSSAGGFLPNGTAGDTTSLDGRARQRSQEHPCFRELAKREAALERELDRESGPGGVGRRL